MKKFRFKLESLETLKKKLQEQSLRNLGDARRKYKEAVDHRNHLVELLNDALLRRENLGLVKTPVSGFITENELISGLKVRIGYASQEIFRRQKYVEIAMLKYLKALKEVKKFESLRDRDYKAYKKQVLKWREKQFDDLMIMRSGFERKESA